MTHIGPMPKLVREDVRPLQFVGIHLKCRHCFPNEHYLKPIGWVVDPTDGVERIASIVVRLCLN